MSHGRATTQLVAKLDGARLQERHAELGLDMLDRAQLARLDDRLETRGERVVAVVKRFHQHAAGARRRIRQQRGLRGICGQRLFA